MRQLPLAPQWSHRIYVRYYLLGCDLHSVWFKLIEVSEENTVSIFGDKYVQSRFLYKTVSSWLPLRNHDPHNGAHLFAVFSAKLSLTQTM
jgi:hypothetical protein